MSEIVAENANGYRKWLVKALSPVLAAVALASCSSEPVTTPLESTDLPTTLAPAFEVVHADIGSVLIDKAKCNGGAARPCAALIRVGPKLEDDYLNADKSQITPVKWPIETHNGLEGDPIKVVCQVNGQQIHDTSGQLTGKHSSIIWDVVAVPSNHISPSTIKQVVVQEGVAYGYMSDLLTDNNAIIASLAPCTPELNPAHADPVK